MVDARFFAPTLGCVNLLNEVLLTYMPRSAQKNASIRNRRKKSHFPYAIVAHHFAAHRGTYMNTWLKKNKGTILFFACFAIFRTAIADWNPVPTASMRPTILEGDVVFVNRLAYNLKVPLTDIVLAKLADPVRGDIVTFSSPKDGTRLIKRIAALPGDTVEMRNGMLAINGIPAQYTQHETVVEPLHQGMQLHALRAQENVAGKQHIVQYMPEVNAKRDFGPFVVPQDQFFMLGDNRDNSEDSRFIGSVPRELLIGRTGRLLVSADIKANWLPRFERFGQALN